MDEILRFLQTWLSRRKDASGQPLHPLATAAPDLDEILSALEGELSALLERLRLRLGDERIDQWLAGEEVGLGRLEPEVADWVSGRTRGGLPAFKKAVAFVQLLSHERGFETVGKIDGRFGPKTRETLPSLEIYELRLIELVQKWLSGRSHELGSELGELGEKTRKALDEELANDERVPPGWRSERRLVAFGQLLCRKYGFDEVGSIDGWLGPSTRGALGLLAQRLSRGPRIGLALSGGGFRASIFHLGVIRRLEELGIMPRVDVISSVSGGSIIAAYYVIEMERRLRTRPLPPPDFKGYAELERQARVEVFEEIATEFFRATDHNLRVRALLFSPFFHPLAALKLLRPGFTRANLFQAEYDRWFFRGNTLAELPLPSPPASEDDTRRGPKLVINTTSLLTGDRIAFSREPLSGIKQLSKVNTNVLRLSRIVGASAGVPGLFPPTPVGGDLLVDGGVSDNQGLEGLWNEGCDVLLVSDASGQMERAHRLKQRAMAVLKRTNSIFQFQIRNQLVRRLLQWRGIAPPEWEREFAFVHLFLSLTGQDGQEDRAVPSEYVAALGRIRTDLDEFNPVEREALMYHGYSLIDSQIKERCPSLWKRSGEEGWAPPQVRDEPVVPRLFNEVVTLGEVRRPEELSEQMIRRRGEIKRILETGSRGMLIVRVLRRHGLKATALLAATWLLPLLLFMGFLWKRLETAISGMLHPLLQAAGSLFEESNFPDWLWSLSRPLAEATDRWSDWPVTTEGLVAGALFLLVNYVLVFFAFSALRRQSRRWDAAVYARLTAGGDPKNAWQQPAPPGSENPGRDSPEPAVQPKAQPKAETKKEARAASS